MLRKMPYYPQVTAEVTTTTMGFEESDCLGIYDKPLLPSVGYIYRVDALACLEKIVGKDSLIIREYLYRSLAGESDALLLFPHLYRRHPTLAQYVNDEDLFGCSDDPLIDRCLDPLRKMVQEYMDTIIKQEVTDGPAKFLIKDHAFLYLRYKVKLDIDYVGGVWIC